MHRYIFMNCQIEYEHNDIIIDVNIIACGNPVPFVDLNHYYVELEPVEKKYEI